MRFLVEYSCEDIIVLRVLFVFRLQSIVMRNIHVVSWRIVGWRHHWTLAQSIFILASRSRLRRLLNPIGMFRFTRENFFDWVGLIQHLSLSNLEHWLFFMRMNRRVFFDFRFSGTQFWLFDLFEFSKVLQIVSLRLLEYFGSFFNILLL